MSIDDAKRIVSILNSLSSFVLIGNTKFISKEGLMEHLRIQFPEFLWINNDKGLTCVEKIEVGLTV